MAAVTSKPKAVRPGVFGAELTKLDEGVVGVLPVGVALNVEGTAVTQAGIHATLQGWLALFKAVDTALAEYKAAVQARLNVTVAARTYCKALKAVLKSHFGSQSALLAAFGILTDKALEITAQQQLVTAAKRAQTRKLHGTRGKQQLAAIKVVGNPEVRLASDGTVAISPPPVNLPAGGTTPGK